MLSLGLDYRVFGMSPLAFKCTNLVIHLLNGALIYWLWCRLAPRLMATSNNYLSPDLPRYLALLAASLWLMHPLNVTDVIYVIQRMNELATLFTLLGLLCYVEGRERMTRREAGLLISLAGLATFGLLAILSKENGAMIVGYALIIEWLCYRFETPHPNQSKLLKTLFIITVALPAALFALYTIIHPQWLSAGYAARDFDLPQRLMSEARILWLYLLWILLPIPSWMGIFHDDIAISNGLLHPWTTIVSIVGLLSLVFFAWKSRRRNPGASFAVAWFLVGHCMESSVIPLELIFEHRNYLPMAGLLFGGLCSVVPSIATRLNTKLTIAICIASVLALAALTSIRANEWGSQLTLALTEVRHHPTSPRAQYEAGRAIVFDGTAKGRQKAAEEEAIPYFERSKALDSTDLYSASSLILIRGGRGANVDQELTDLARRVRNIKQAQINPFLVVMTAASEGKINVTTTRMEQLVNAAFDNVRFSATMRAMILNNYGHYQFQIVHDDQAAISLTMAAAAQDPQNPLFEINLTKLALALGDVRQAARHLQIAEQLDKAHMYDESIADLRQQVLTGSH